KKIVKINGNCPVIRLQCEYCDCSGISCQSRFLGLKVEWPELKGVSGPEAKRKIEGDNPHVNYWSVNCCNRVLLRVPVGNCLNGPVVNSPRIG
ncbi:hypothetical protein EUTSA_v10011021mg, partial [Eutrema salsugineum]